MCSTSCGEVWSDTTIYLHGDHLGSVSAATGVGDIDEVAEDPADRLHDDARLASQCTATGQEIYCIEPLAIALAKTRVSTRGRSSAVGGLSK